MGADQTFVKVNSSTLTAKADDLTADYPTVSGAAAPPCMLVISGLAMRKIDQNFEQLVATLTAGKAEADRLAACLRAAGRAYDEADLLGRTMIEGRAPTGADSVTVNPDLPPSAPVTTGGQCTVEPEDPGVDWISAVRQINAGDQGSSLRDFADALYTLSDRLTDHGKKFSMGNTHWEGTAAEAADGALRLHESWLYDLAGQTRALAQQARDFADVHISEHPQHPTEADVAAMDKLDGANLLSAYAAKQQQSDDVRHRYAGRVAFADLTFTSPPPGAYPTQPVSSADVASGSASPTTPAGGGSGGGSGGGGPAPTAGAAQLDPSNVKPVAAQGESTPGQSGGEKSGGGSGGEKSGGEGGGTPSGGGLPGGSGATPGERPGSGPGLHDGARLKPASAGSGGGGAGGGGLGGHPLQPAASAPALGTSPASGGSAHGGTAGPGGPIGGVMGGGMGGMGHGPGRDGGKEKKRNPNLSLDEPLYVEDRPYTEPVVGHTRRTRIEDKKETD